MNIRNNAKVIEAIERSALFSYFEKLVDAKTSKVALFSVFPYTAAANLSDKKVFFLLDDLSRLTNLNSGSPRN